MYIEYLFKISFSQHYIQILLTSNPIGYWWTSSALTERETVTDLSSVYSAARSFATWNVDSKIIIHCMRRGSYTDYWLLLLPYKVYARVETIIWSDYKALDSDQLTDLWWESAPRYNKHWRELFFFAIRMRVTSAIFSEVNRWRKRMKLMLDDFFIDVTYHDSEDRKNVENIDDDWKRHLLNSHS